MTYPVLSQSTIPGAKLLNRGKVRDIYEVNAHHLLIVATDRISAFDVVMREPVPAKGLVLTQLSKYWFQITSDIVENHFITDQVSEFPSLFRQYSSMLAGRSMLVKRAEPLTVECIVRGYLAGSGWKEYRQSGTVHGISLPSGLQEGSQVPEPLFTPSTKAESGHDVNITFQQMVDMVGQEVAENIREISLALYQRAAQIAESRGIIIADTKFEFGISDEELILIDEVLTPDSSRFWPLETYQPGKSQPSLDKQYVRDYLESLDWDKSPPPPPLPEEIIQNTSKKYLEILRRLTGRELEDFLQELNEEGDRE